MRKILLIIFLVQLTIFPQSTSFDFHSPQKIKLFADYLFCEKDYLRAIEEYEMIRNQFVIDTIEFKVMLGYSNLGLSKNSNKIFSDFNIESKLYPDAYLVSMKNELLIDSKPLHYSEFSSFTSSQFESYVRLLNISALYGDEQSITKNNFLTLVSYPTISGYYQQKAIMVYLKEMKANNKEKFWVSISQYVVLVLWIAAALIIDWEKALLFVIIPQQVSLFSVLIFNYVQHVHANEESEWDHSRNFTGFLNFLLFNNGYHTIHHHKAGLHWSKVPEAHKEIEKNINPILLERSFWWYIFRSYILSIFIPKFRTNSMRLERLRKEKMKVVGAETQTELQVS